MTYDEKLACNKIYYENNRYKISLQRKEYYEKNKDKMSVSKKEYYEQNKDKNKDKRNSYAKEYYEQNKDKKNSYAKEYYEKNKDKMNSYAKEYYEKNKDKKLADAKDYYQKNKDKMNANAREYYEKNKDKMRVYSKERHKNRIQIDPLYKIACTCKNRIRNYYRSKGLKKSKDTFDMIGCTPTELRDHLQSQFTVGMTFENHGEWHIDHIIPLASAKTEEEIIKLCHYTNLQPLWAKDNWSKGTKLTLIKINTEVYDDKN